MKSNEAEKVHASSRSSIWNSTLGGTKVGWLGGAQVDAHDGRLRVLVGEVDGPAAGTGADVEDAVDRVGGVLAGWPGRGSAWCQRS